MSKIADLRLDDSLRAKLPPPLPSELEILEESIRREGVREPLIAWKTADGPLLVDGYTRLPIYHKFENEGIDIAPPAIVEREFESQEAAEAWILANQLGRRNLTRAAMKDLRGRLYNLAKKPVGQHGAKKLDQNEPTSTAESLAPTLQVSPATLRRAGAYAANLNTIEANVGPQARQEVLSMQSGLTERDVATIARMPPGQQAEGFALMKQKAQERRMARASRPPGPRVGGLRVSASRGIVPKDVRDWLKKFVEKVDRFSAADLEGVLELLERVRDAVHAELTRQRPVDAEPTEVPGS